MRLAIYMYVMALREYLLPIIVSVLCIFSTVQISRAEDLSNKYIQVDTVNNTKLQIEIDLSYQSYGINPYGVMYDDVEYTLYHESLGSFNEETMVPNAECAVQLASVYFSHLPQEPFMQDKVPYVAYYYEKDMVWIVGFDDETNISSQREGHADDEEVTVTIGGQIFVAIQATDGKVLRIWQEE